MMRMDERKRKVLEAIILDYISTAEPVGSRVIAKKYNLGVSPATIRNEMSDLEEQGYIEQPHTSAGRVPSDLGYRYYVDFLMERKKLELREVESINKSYDNRVHEVSQVIQRTSQILSEVTNYTAIVLGPQFGGCAFKHIQLVPVDIGKALVVVVTENGFVQNKMIDIPENIRYEDLNAISQVLNDRLRGLTLQDIKLTLIREIYTELNKHKLIFNTALELMEENLGIEPEEKIYLGGKLNILNQPEFKDVEKVKTLLSLLEQEELIRNVLTESPLDNGVRVKIGGENSIEAIKDCSMITATYHIDGKVIGAIGVLGPTRMEYSKVVSLVEFINANLSHILKDFYHR